MKLLRDVSFGLTGLIAIVLAVATGVEKMYGGDVASCLIYGSPWMVALWAAAAAASAVYICTRCRAMTAAAVAIHAAFLLILAGAAVTHFGSRSGTLRLEQGAPAVASFSGGELPFAVALDSTVVEYYPGTTAAADYVSVLAVELPGEPARCCRVSMNNVLRIDGYRFYQSGLGPGYTVLSVVRDPWGIGITYGGYLLLGVAMAAFLCSPHTRFRQLLRRCAVVVLAVSAAVSAGASGRPLPSAIPAPLAARMGDMFVYYGDRVMPLGTMARDFCNKVYGSSSYRGLTAEQVLTGWLFYYDSWKHEPMIRVAAPVGRMLGVGGRYASLADFYSPRGYALDPSVADMADRQVREADDRVALVTSVCTGRALRIFPVARGRNVEWLSPADRMEPGAAVSAADLDMMACEIGHRQWRNALDITDSIISAQLAAAPPGTLPSRFRFVAEKTYNRVGGMLIPAIAAILVGLAAFFTRKRLAWAVGALFVWLTFVMALRTVIGGHLPLSNGYETMLAMAWLALGLGLLCGRRLRVLASTGPVVAGLAMMVAVMGRGGDTVAHLMPVLASPLLSVHVLLVMCSYALFAMMALNSLAALIARRDGARVASLADVTSMLLYPAVMLLAAGIFVGAVWANQSWGRYWGWDPKETWALVTLIVYALPLHAASWPAFRRPAVIHAYAAAAFLCVLMTYFGVNYLLSGLHSYQ